MLKRFFKFLFLSSLILGFLGAIVGTVVGFYFYFRFTRDMPRIERISDYHPKAVTSFYAEDGSLIGEIYEERRYPVEFKEIPPVVKNAFLSAEDANFYQHPGVDVISILRALWVNLHNKRSKQGASTITQQVVKSLLLTREKTYERKAKEAILAYRLEKYLTKDEILSIYLNEIFLGATTYGVKAAAKIHFHKELDQLNIAEAAFLAGLPQRPSYLIDPQHRDEAIRRQRYVLNQMQKNGYISEAQEQEAELTQLEIYSSETKKIDSTAYFVSHAIKELEDRLKLIDRQLTPTNPGGYSVYTTADVHAHEIAVRALRRGMKEVDKRIGWRGPIGLVDKNQLSNLLEQQAQETKTGLVPDQIYTALVTRVDPNSKMIGIQIGDNKGALGLKEAKWAQRFLDKNDVVRNIDLTHFIKVGNLVEVSLLSSDTGSKNPLFKLDQTPQLEGAFVLLDPFTGKVKVIIGGYDYQRSEFNRATQGLRQPGSSFKPFIYLSALEYLNYTPATIVPDSPISLVAGNGMLWSPQNFDHKFLGPITLRTALERSRNVVSVFLTRKTGLDRIINMAHRLGITTPIGRDMSISLGTSEVKLIDLTKAYGVFAASGWLADQLIFKKVIDRNGKVIFEDQPHQRRVISDESAFLMANMMKGVVERGTATTVRALKRPVAGKTGTTNEHMDTWFIGYTPEWAAGTWVGYDVKKKIGARETGGRVAAPIFLYFMQEFLAGTPVIDFEIPNGVTPFPINRTTGQPTDPGSSDAFLEYFKTGTESTNVNSAEADSNQPSSDYLSNSNF